MQTLWIVSCITLAPLPVAADSVEDAKTALLDRLKDPESARISDVKLKNNFVCGWVNAKTSGGGYAGKKLWLYSLNSKAVEIDGGGIEILADPRHALGFRFKEGTCD